ncbi:MAG: MFS transporter [Bdellovibrionaceae bacterium]|nr:MFS transporter [Pseudobdellovibrionaceae bacterium]
MNKRVLLLILIIISGESIFMLPFMIPRLYRPLLLETWNINNTALGAAFSAYGFTAMLSYLIGGPLADKFHPRFLISLSLALTALGSLPWVFFPSELVLIITYAFFGFSTIFFMWGALIKTTHIAGGEDQRSTAMGALDGGRGLTAALFSSLLVFILFLVLPELNSAQNKIQALRIIYLSTSLFIIFLSVLVGFGLKDFLTLETLGNSKWNIANALSSLRNTNVWLLSIVVLSAYCGYKSIDNYSIYLVDVMHKDLSSSAFITSIVIWLRPFSALAAGVFADRFHQKSANGRLLVLLLLLVLSGFAQLLLTFTADLFFSYSVVILLTSATLIYALRAIYFSIFSSLKIKNHLLGTTVGIVSFVGFLPDLFFGFITGTLIDLNPGELGFKYTFLFTASCLFAGAMACYILYRRLKKSPLSATE